MFMNSCSITVVPKVGNEKIQEKELLLYIACREFYFVL